MATRGRHRGTMCWLLFWRYVPITYHSARPLSLALVHFSTFLSVLIPNVSSSPPLSPRSFLPVWLSSTIIPTFLAGRWKYCALALSGLSGGYAAHSLESFHLT